MRDTVVKIPAELFALAESSRFEGVYDIKALSIGPDDYLFAKPVSWSVDMTNTGSALLVSGSAKGVGSCACSRCLEDVAHGFEGTIEGYLLINQGPEGDFEGAGEDFDESEFDILPDDHMVDLAPLIEAALFVDAPDMPLCREDCAGLCPQCGANLNDGPCGCGADPELEAFARESSPFAALADFKFE